MAVEQRARIDDAMMAMFEDVDKSYLRILRMKMFKCAATCCEDKEASMQSVERCIMTCSQPLEHAKNFVTDEFNHFQDRLQRCVMSCNDNIRDLMGVETKESEINKYTKQFENCAKKCVDTHIDLIPDILKKIKEAMKNEKY